MRIVEKKEDFVDALLSAKREAMSSFGDDNVLVEKYITKCVRCSSFLRLYFT